MKYFLLFFRYFIQKIINNLPIFFMVNLNLLILHFNISIIINLKEIKLQRRKLVNKKMIWYESLNGHQQGNNGKGEHVGLKHWKRLGGLRGNWCATISCSPVFKKLLINWCSRSQSIFNTLLCISNFSLPSRPLLTPLILNHHL